MITATKQSIRPEQHYQTITIYDQDRAVITKVCNVLRVRTAKDTWARVNAINFLEKNGWVKLGRRGRFTTLEDVLSYRLIDHGFYEEWIIEVNYLDENRKEVPTE